MLVHFQIDYMLADCFLAVGQAVGEDAALDHTAIVWWRDRYRAKFEAAVTVAGNDWDKDRTRVLSVSRFLGQRAAAHAGDTRRIDRECAARASAEVEAGCTMRARANIASARSLPGV